MSFGITVAVFLVFISFAAYVGLKDELLGDLAVRQLQDKKQPHQR